MKILIRSLFVAVGLVNLVPVTGAWSAARLQSLYGIPIAGPNLELAMRHRAVLLGIVGLLLCAAAVNERLRVPAALVGFVSMGSFIVLAWLVGESNAEMSRVALADCVGIVLLLVACGLDAANRSRSD